MEGWRPGVMEQRNTVAAADTPGMSDRPHEADDGGRFWDAPSGVA